MGKNGRISAKIGMQFQKEVERIKDAKLRNGTAKDRPSTQTITDLIVHAKAWEGISMDMINLGEEEIRRELTNGNGKS